MLPRVVSVACSRARVIAHPQMHAEWVMLGVSTSLTGAAWIIGKDAL
jgi:hypothetical protein